MSEGNGKAKPLGLPRSGEVAGLLVKAGVEADEGVLKVGGAKVFGPFITAAKKHRVGASPACARRVGDDDPLCPL